MPEVAVVCKRSRQHSLPYLPVLHSPEEDIEHFTAVVFAKNEVYLAVDDEQKIVGFIAFNKEWIEHIYLLPEAQGKRIGDQLLMLAKQYSSNLKLWTFQRNVFARRFYARNGFKAVKETDGADNEEREPDILFEWVE